MKIDALRLRADVIRNIRTFFHGQGFLEVETPALIPANAPEEYIDPVPTISSWQLQTSPELCMKRLLTQGHSKLFQISRCWRSGERGMRHLSEFTMLEWYRADSGYLDLMNDCEKLMQSVAESCLPSGATYRHRSAGADPFLPWQCFSLEEAFQRFGTCDVWKSLADGTFEEIVTSMIEPALSAFTSPVFLKDYPAELAALARLRPDDRKLAERFELYVCGLELANGFSELTDPAEQRSRFEAANRTRQQDGRSPLPLPEPFLRALERMPPSAGIALGVDRLVMLTAGADSIDEIVAFTPEDL